MTRSQRPFLFAALATWCVALGLLTLAPSGHTPPLTLGRFFCVACGWRDSADMVLNWLLFIPGGAVLALLVSGRSAVVIAIMITCGVELVQVGIPGRDPAFQDLVLNTLGAMSGAAFIALRPLPRLPALAGVVAAVAWLLPAVLLVPRPTEADLYGQWTASFGNLDKYEGEILDARIADMPLPSRLVDDSEALRSLIRGRANIELVLVAGPPTDGLAPILSIYDANQTEILFLGAIGPNLLLRGRNLARIVGLDQPDARWPGALSGLQPGDTARLVLDRSGASICGSAGGRRTCDLASRLGDGWGFLLNLEGASSSLRAFLSALWTVGIGITVGAGLRSASRALLAGACLSAIGLAVATWSPDLRPHTVFAALLFVATGLGPSVRIGLTRTLDRLGGQVS